MLEHRVFFIILFVAISLLGLEYIIVNNYVDKKTNPKKNKPSNITSNLNDLNNKQKNLLGISSNSNENKTDESSVTTKDIVSNKLETKKEELSNSNKNKAYEEYEKLSEEEKKKQEVIPSKDKVDIDKLDELDTNNQKLPTKFDLNDKIKLNYKNQGSYGLCWDFASTKVFETYMALNYNKYYDFSEIAMDYLTSEYLYNYKYLHDGGNFTMYNNIVDKLDGIVETKNMNKDYYHNYTEEEYLNIFNMPKVNIGEYEVVKFPMIYYMDGKYYGNEEEEINNETLEKYRDAMKNHIMNNSALYFMAHHFTKSLSPSYVKNNLPEGEYKNVNWKNSFYCKGDDCNNGMLHAMAIIGWDDNFDRRVFRREDENGKIYIPEHNGAFLVANSWDNSKTYYYISYEDTELYSEIVGIKKPSKKDTTGLFNLNTLKPAIVNAIKDSYYSEDIIVSNGVNYISYDILKKINWLELDNSNLTSDDLKDLKYFENLNSISLKNNNITSLDFLSNLTSLEYVDLSNNKITDITPIGNLKKLVTVNLADNNITDVTPLSSLYELDDIILDNNNITNYKNAFYDLSNLAVLSLENCSIEELTLNSSNDYSSLNLSKNPNLKLTNKVSTYIVELNNNNLTDLSILDFFNETNLSSIDLSNNDIKNIDGLSKFKGIESLNLAHNKNIESYNVIKDIFKDETKETTNENSNSITTSIYKTI